MNANDLRETARAIAEGDNLGFVPNDAFFAVHEALWPYNRVMLFEGREHALMALCLAAEVTAGSTS